MRPWSAGTAAGDGPWFWGRDRINLIGIGLPVREAAAHREANHAEHADPALGPIPGLAFWSSCLHAGRRGRRRMEEDGDRGQVPLRGRGDRRREQGRQARRPHRRLVVRGPALDQARHPQARRLRRRPAQLQRVHDLLGRRHQRRRLGRPDRHRLPRRARPTGTRTPRASRATGPSTRSGPAPATRRRSTPTSSATAAACWSWAGSPRARTTKGQMAWFTPGSDPTQPWEMHPVSEPSSPGKADPRHLPVLPRPRRRRPERRRPQGRDLHRRLVGAARVGPRRRARPGRSTPPSSATPWPT